MATASETPIPANEHQLTRERVGIIAGWLVDGKLRPDCVSTAIEQWQVSRRMAQVYVARAAARIVKATTFQDPHFALKLSQIQRDKLHQELQELLRGNGLIEHSNWQLRLKTIQADMKLLDSRDRTAAKLIQLEAKQKTDPRPPRPPQRAASAPSVAGFCEAGRKERTEPLFSTTTPAGLSEAGYSAGLAEASYSTTPGVPPVVQGKPQDHAPRGVITRKFMAEVQTALRGAPQQPSAAIAIAQGGSKQKGYREMRHGDKGGLKLAPDFVSCAFETPVVADTSEPRP